MINIAIILVNSLDFSPSQAAEEERGSFTGPPFLERLSFKYPETLKLFGN